MNKLIPTALGQDSILYLLDRYCLPPNIEQLWKIGSIKGKLAILNKEMKEAHDQYRILIKEKPEINIKDRSLNFTLSLTTTETITTIITTLRTMII